MGATAFRVWVRATEFMGGKIAQEVAKRNDGSLSSPRLIVVDASSWCSGTGWKRHSDKNRALSPNKLRQLCKDALGLGTEIAIEFTDRQTDSKPRTKGPTNDNRICDLFLGWWAHGQTGRGRRGGCCLQRRESQSPEHPRAGHYRGAVRE